MPWSIILQRIRASLGAKVVMLSVVFVLIVLLAISAVQWVQRSVLRELRAAEARERSAVLAEVIQLASQRLHDFVRDNSEWDEMVRFIGRQNRKWAIDNIDGALDSWGLSGAWVFGPDGGLRYASAGEKQPQVPPLPLSEQALAVLRRSPPAGSFFVKQENRLTELCLAPVRPSDPTDRRAPPEGWLLVGKAWDSSHLRLLSRLLGNRARLVPPSQQSPGLAATDVRLSQPLRGPGGEVVAEIEFVFASEDIALATSFGQNVILVLALGCSVLAAIVFTAFYFWVLRPLAVIGDSLTRNDPSVIGDLARRDDEMGRLARLVESSFAQRSALEKNLQYRTRLSQNLHDGAIQMVYAAGMSLAGAQAALHSNPGAAERTIQDVRQVLNATIRDLRSFIEEAEAEPLREPHLSGAVRSILVMMQGVRPFGFVVEVDDALAERLDPAVRLHLLQIVREAVSNSVRHGQASKVEVHLRSEAGRVLLEICDDGKGLEDSLGGNGGHGLSNLTQRTRELGGVLRLASRPGEGLCLEIGFPLASGA